MTSQIGLRGTGSWETAAQRLDPESRAQAATGQRFLVSRYHNLQCALVEMRSGGWEYQTGKKVPGDRIKIASTTTPCLAPGPSLKIQGSHSQASRKVHIEQNRSTGS